MLSKLQSLCSSPGYPTGALGAAGIQPGLCTAISNASAPATLGESRHDLLTRLSPSRFPPHRPPPSQAHQTAKRPSVAAPEPAGRTSSVADAATCPLLVPAKHPPPSLRTQSTELVLHKLAWVRPVEGIGEAGVPATSRGEGGGVQNCPKEAGEPGLKLRAPESKLHECSPEPGHPPFQSVFLWGLKLDA